MVLHWALTNGIYCCCASPHNICNSIENASPHEMIEQLLKDNIFRSDQCTLETSLDPIPQWPEVRALQQLKMRWYCRLNAEIKYST